MSEGASVESGLVVVIVVKLGSEGPRVNLSTPAAPAAPPSITYTVCSCAVNPILLARTRWAPSGTSGRTKPPSSRVTAPRSVPTTVTRTPTTGRAVGASVTCPTIVPGGACALAALPTSAPLSASQVAYRHLMRPASLRLRRLRAAAQSPAGAELEAPITAVEGDRRPPPVPRMEHEVRVEPAAQPQAIAPAVAQAQRGRHASVAGVQPTAVRVAHGAATQQDLEALTRRDGADEPEVGRGVRDRAAPPPAGGRTGHVQLARDRAFQKDRRPPADPDRVVQGQTVVEIGVACACPDLHCAGALRPGRHRADEPRGRQRTTDSAHHDHPSYRARFVVTTMTPLAPREPYRLVAPASLSTSIRAMSRGA